MDGFWFKSTRFEIEPGEDADINPSVYGRQLAAWLKIQLELRGYAIEQIIAEDWGRCLMCSRHPFLLWVGCGNVFDPAPDAALPAKGDIVWHCFATAEVPFWRRVFGRVDTAPYVAKLNADLRAILDDEPQITLVPEP
jgi:hypothetical protein